MEQVTELLERIFAAVLFCIACTLLFCALTKYQEIVQSLDAIGHEVWHAE